MELEMYGKANMGLEEYYKAWCAQFGIAPTENYKKLLNTKKKKPQTEEDDFREEIINQYKRACARFGVPELTTLDELHTSKIENRTMTLIDDVVEERYSKFLLEIADPVWRNKVRTTIRALYDQEQYITEEEVKELASAKTNKELQFLFNEFGGNGFLLELDLIESGDEIDEEEDNEEWTENF